MKKRKTRDIAFGGRAKNYDNEVHLSIKSKCPGKWRFVDLETLDIWKWDEKRNCYTRANDLKFTLVDKENR